MHVYTEKIIHKFNFNFAALNSSSIAGSCTLHCNFLRAVDGTKFVYHTSIFTVNVPFDASIAFLMRSLASCSFAIPPSLSSVDVVITYVGGAIKLI